MKRRIAVLTGGGDTCALNATISGISERANKYSWETYGVCNGYRGLMGKTGTESDLRSMDGISMIDLTGRDLSCIQYKGGSILGSSRDVPTDSKKYPYGIEKCLKVMEQLGIDCLVPIGGDDTNRAAQALCSHGARVVTVNKTMDNDIIGTDLCLGYPSAAFYATHFAGGLHSTLKTNGRDAVIYSFGRKAGWAPLASASWTDPNDPEKYPHVVFVPEMGKVSVNTILEAYDRLRRRHGYAELVISEGLQLTGLDEDEIRIKHPELVDPSGNVDLKALDVPLHVAELIRDHRGLTGQRREKEVIYREMDYVLRSGPPIPQDKRLAIMSGRRAADLIEAEKTGYMVNLKLDNGSYTVGEVPLNEVSGGRTLDRNMFDAHTLSPTREFIEYVKAFVPDPERYRPLDWKFEPIDMREAALH